MKIVLEFKNFYDDFYPTNQENYQDMMLSFTQPMFHRQKCRALFKARPIHRILEFLDWKFNSNAIRV